MLKMSRGGVKSNQDGFEHVPWCRKQVLAKISWVGRPNTQYNRLVRSPIYKQCKKSKQEPLEQQVFKSGERIKEITCCKTHTQSLFACFTINSWFKNGASVCKTFSRKCSAASTTQIQNFPSLKDDIGIRSRVSINQTRYTVYKFDRINQIRCDTIFYALHLTIVKCY